MLNNTVFTYVQYKIPIFVKSEDGYFNAEK
ncbi:hypothetical protein ABIA69_002347 [Lysinibacillus parviboronicapiens]|uniref:Uncharacterized protein n=1 Tax=Lysinibacillus parviboronicapiens TaxID=436516 RepID=A0ABV2PJT4_9BACI